MYSTGLVPTYDKPEGSVPVLSLGRYGSLTIQHRPADDAFIAMFDSAKKIIRMSLQDVSLYLQCCILPLGFEVLDIPLTYTLKISCVLS